MKPNPIVEAAKEIAQQWVIGPDRGGSLTALRKGMEAELVRRWYVACYGDISWSELGAILGRDRTGLPAAAEKFLASPLGHRIGEAEEQHTELARKTERQLWLGSVAGDKNAKGTA